MTHQELREEILRLKKEIYDAYLQVIYSLFTCHNLQPSG